ncbi:hypothetical protein [Rosenbergiella epipactidis]|uniref:hypothetical protein n=1 Tax=Rosenbergiella epipactidis TaxID=1544694 RepID=UPI001F4EB0B8|nr:hypothetical protein [Rosenbergiella epipactidis]
MLLPDKSIVLTYFQSTRSHAMFSDNRRVSDNNQFRSQATLVHYTYRYRRMTFLNIEP